MFPLRLNGGDTDATILGPAIEGSKDLILSDGIFSGERVRAHQEPAAVDAIHAIEELGALVDGLAQVGDVHHALFPKLREWSEEKLVAGPDSHDANGENRKELLTFINIHGCLGSPQ